MKHISYSALKDWSFCPHYHKVVHIDKKKAFKGNEYTGIDIERKGYGQAKKLVDKFYDGKTIPFDNEIFDGAICTQVLGVCDDERSLVKEINRILKKDGYFVVATPFIYIER